MCVLAGHFVFARASQWLSAVLVLVVSGVWAYSDYITTLTATLLSVVPFFFKSINSQLGDGCYNYKVKVSAQYSGVANNEVVALSSRSHISLIT